MTAEEGTIGTSGMSTEAGPPESDNRKVSREDTNIQQEHQQQQQELTTRTFATAAETIGTSQTSTASTSISRDANSRGWTSTTHEFSRKFVKNGTAKNLWRKTQKEQNPHF
jgi:hypothetical protein